MATPKHEPIDHRPLSWQELGTILKRVDANSSWRDSASSFTDWVAKRAAEMRLAESNLWRYLTSVRYFEYLKTALKDSGHDAPSLSHLPESVGPESLELLSKLQRAMPREAFVQLALAVLCGSVTRSKLRDTWRAFRPALGGRTARGKGVAAPLVDPRDTKQRASVLEALVYTALSDSGPAWTGVSEPNLYRLIANVALRGEGQRSTTEIDVVAVVQEAPGTGLIFHGVEIRGPHFTAKLPDTLRKQALFVDHMWLAVPGSARQLHDLQIPEATGILVVSGTHVQVTRPAQRRHPSPLTGDLAKALLAQVLR